MWNNCCCEYNDPGMEDDCCPDWCEANKRVKGRFGLAFVAETPCCCPEPIGWQVEFCDTPSKVEQRCREMVQWANCPPLPRCEPCPPVEVCSPCYPPRCNPCCPISNPCPPRCPARCCPCPCPRPPPCPRKCCGSQKPKRSCCCSSRSRQKCRCEDDDDDDDDQGCCQCEKKSNGSKKSKKRGDRDRDRGRDRRRDPDRGDVDSFYDDELPVKEGKPKTSQDSSSKTHGASTQQPYRNSDQRAGTPPRVGTGRNSPVQSKEINQHSYHSPQARHNQSAPESASNLNQWPEYSRKSSISNNNQWQEIGGRSSKLDGSGSKTISGSVKSKHEENNLNHSQMMNNTDVEKAENADEVNANQTSQMNTNSQAFVATNNYSNEKANESLVLTKSESRKSHSLLKSNVVSHSNVEEYGYSRSNIGDVIKEESGTKTNLGSQSNVEKNNYSQSMFGDVKKDQSGTKTNLNSRATSKTNYKTETAEPVAVASDLRNVTAYGQTVMKTNNTFVPSLDSDHQKHVNIENKNVKVSKNRNKRKVSEVNKQSEVSDLKQKNRESESNDDGKLVNLYNVRSVKYSSDNFNASEGVLNKIFAEKMSAKGDAYNAVRGLGVYKEPQEMKRFTAVYSSFSNTRVSTSELEYSLLARKHKWNPLDVFKTLKEKVVGLFKTYVDNDDDTDSNYSDTVPDNTCNDMSNSKNIKKN